MKDQVASFLLAVQFLTRLPIPGWLAYTEARMAGSAAYYPLVGVLVGALCSAVFWGASLLFPPLVSIILAIAAGLLLTGAFHEDGLADTFDGIGGGHTRESALEIMRDSRLGTYGTLALVAALGLKAAILTDLPSHLLLYAFPAAHGLSRLSSVITIATSRYVRTEGTGKPVSQGISLPGLLIAGITAAAILLTWIYLLPAAPMLLGLAGLTIGHVAMRAFFEFKLNGYTGDTLGAVQQASEIGFYLGLLAWL
ncbi:MAG: adenosylcobinamide-GDP ribazoletransferase [Alphaproteobacteria bacterium]|nr:adenosylcobinamide-GDP ribazoletransferase [Alphaproteobacteria bacterium]MBU2084288.1 adenosylcobinamide-GDP ribazoletransferase [Alphaproteobacteria bacterium]MBU2141426.1 adenosylcobinamide-GDP ribazoletransferase [Alphaproteobacteria bacterium]MBU2197364.1 adenosylcobinamide-GDP ribazoletransferase [Alphaproteobacteria bacterium]